MNDTPDFENGYMKNEELDRQIEEALAALNPRQRRYVLIMSEGQKPIEQALISAGYTPKTARGRGNRILANTSVNTALQLLLRKHALMHGESAGQHRQHLRDLYRRVTDPNSDEKDLNLAHRIRRTLGEIDDVLKPCSNAQVAAIQINVSTGVDRGDPKVIEHEDD